MEKFKGCPFCKKEIVYVPPAGPSPEHWIECHTCKYHIYWDVDIDESEMVKRFNRRN